MRCDVGIRAGRIAALGADLPAAGTEIDATGLYVLPGGVEGHCHFDEPIGGGVAMADDFASGTVSAAFGGTTTVIPFARQCKGQGLEQAVDDYHRRADGKPVVDYAFHLIITDPTKDVIERELPRLVSAGYTSFKIYMTYDDLKLNDRQILETLDAARRLNAVAMIHAENTDCIDWLTENLERAGHTAPHFHAQSRPALVEGEAVHRAIAYAELVDVPILIVHVSGGDAVRHIARARSRGLPIYAETCPQYLFLTADDLDRGGFEGAKYVCSPPPRTVDDQRVIWNGLRNGLFEIFSADHAPFRFDDERGKRNAGTEAPFRKIPNGIPGIETRLALLFSRGVLDGRLDLCRFVALTSTNPARMYGLYPRKGTLAVGADADVAIWDPRKALTISNDLLHHNVDYTPYEGMEVQGWPVTVLSRGETIVDDGTLLARPGRGQFLPCQRRGSCRLN